MGGLPVGIVAHGVGDSPSLHVSFFIYLCFLHLQCIIFPSFPPFRICEFIGGKNVKAAVGLFQAACSSFPDHPVLNPEVNDKTKAKSNQDASSESEMETENEGTEEGRARNFIGRQRFGVADSSESSERKSIAETK